MADTLSDHYCSLCGFSFNRFGTKEQNVRTSLASEVVEQSGLLDMLNISVLPMKKELIFICYSCRVVFTNYTSARNEAIKLLTEPAEKSEQLKFVPYLKRKLISKNVDVPTKFQKCAADGKLGIVGPMRGSDINQSNSAKCDSSRKVNEPESSHSASKLQVIRSEALKLLEQGLYRSALRKLWITSKKFRSSLLSFLTNLIKKETRNLLNHKTIFTMEFEQAHLNELSWGPTMSILSQVAPVTLQLLYALLGVNSSIASQEIKDIKQSLVGAILSMALYKRYRGKASFIPLLHSLYLHNTGTPIKVNRILQEFGLTAPPGKLYEALDHLAKSSSSNQGIQKWKTDLEAALETIHRRAEVSPKKGPPDRRKRMMVLPKASSVFSFSLSWDAIQYPSHSSKSKRKMVPQPLMGQAYAAKSRVPFSMTYKDWDVRLATNIPFDEYVPDSEDFLRVREQMKIEVKKIIVKHIENFSEEVIVENHSNSELMAEKSKLVDLGSIFKCPTDNGSAATLLKDLKQYMVYDGEDHIPVCVFGNPSAVEKMVGAKDVMSCFSEKLDRLDGLEPCVTDFGRQILIAQDIIKIFYPNGMAPERGNLHHLWSKFKPELKGETPDYKAISSFLEVIAHGHTVCLAKKKLHNYGMLIANNKSITDARMLERVAEDIVCSIWPRIDTPSFDTVRQGNESARDGDCSFGDCVNFHEKARLPCSERCSRPFYFCCRKPLNDGLIECGRRENCPRGGWFHLNKKCSGLSEAPEDEWLCYSCAVSIKDNLEEPDFIWEYHRGLLWYCLFFSVAQSAEAQGNGWLLHAVWKVCMPFFERRGHLQYLQQGYSYLSAVAGRIPRLSAHDTVHNRTVNLKGGKSNNISWDRALEAFNQELLRKPPREAESREDPIASGRAVGAMLYLLNSSWEKKICQKPDMRERDLKKTIREYVAFVGNTDIFQKLPGRHPYNEVQYAHNILIQNPKEMVSMLKDLCDKDETRQLNERESDVLE